MNSSLDTVASKTLILLLKIIFKTLKEVDHLGIDRFESKNRSKGLNSTTVIEATKKLLDKLANIPLYNLDNEDGELHQTVCCLVSIYISENEATKAKGLLTSWIKKLKKDHSTYKIIEGNDNTELYEDWEEKYLASITGLRISYSKLMISSSKGNPSRTIKWLEHALKEVELFEKDFPELFELSSSLPQYSDELNDLQRSLSRAGRTENKKNDSHNISRRKGSTQKMIEMIQEDNHLAKLISQKISGAVIENDQSGTMSNPSKLHNENDKGIKIRQKSQSFNTKRHKSKLRMSGTYKKSKKNHEQNTLFSNVDSPFVSFQKQSDDDLLSSNESKKKKMLRVSSRSPEFRILNSKTKKRPSSGLRNSHQSRPTNNSQSFFNTIHRKKKKKRTSSKIKHRPKSILKKRRTDNESPINNFNRPQTSFTLNKQYTEKHKIVDSGMDQMSQIVSLVNQCKQNINEFQTLQSHQKSDQKETTSSPEYSSVQFLQRKLGKMLESVNKETQVMDNLKSNLFNIENKLGFSNTSQINSRKNIQKNIDITKEGGAGNLFISGLEHGRTSAEDTQEPFSKGASPINNKNETRMIPKRQHSNNLNNRQFKNSSKNKIPQQSRRQNRVPSAYNTSLTVGKIGAINTQANRRNSEVKRGLKLHDSSLEKIDISTSQVSMLSNSKKESTYMNENRSQFKQLHRSKSLVSSDQQMRDFPNGLNNRQQTFLKLLYKIKKLVFEDQKTLLTFKHKQYSYGDKMSLELVLEPLPNTNSISFVIKCFKEDLESKQIILPESKFIILSLAILRTTKAELKGIPFRKFVCGYIFPYIKVSNLFLIDQINEHKKLVCDLRSPSLIKPIDSIYLGEDARIFITNVKFFRLFKVKIENINQVER